MAAILATYLATSYGFSGLICSLAFLKADDRPYEAGQEQGNAVLLTCMAIVTLWPLWIIKETYYPEPHQSLAEMQTEQPGYSKVL